MSIERLREFVPPERFIDDAVVLSRYVIASDQGPVPPDAVLVPTSVGRLQRIVQAVAEQEGISLVPGLAGTSGVTAFGCDGQLVLLDLRLLNRIERVLPVEGVAILEPGVTYAQLDETLRNHELPWALGFTMGPRHGTVVGGCVNAGVTSRSWSIGRLDEALEAVQVVLPDGRVQNAGPKFFGLGDCDLTSTLPPQAFIAAHGGKGIITKVALRLARVNPWTAQVFSLCDKTVVGLEVLDRACASDIVEQVLAISNAALKIALGLPHPPPKIPPGDPSVIVAVTTSAQTVEQMTVQQDFLHKLCAQTGPSGVPPSAPIDAQALAKVFPGLIDFASNTFNLSRVPLPENETLQWLGFTGPMSLVPGAIRLARELLSAQQLPSAWIVQSVHHGRQADLRWFFVTDRSPTQPNNPTLLFRALSTTLGSRGFSAYHLPATVLQDMHARPAPSPERVSQSSEQLANHPATQQATSEESP